MGRLYMLVRADDELDEQLNLAAEQIDSGTSKYKGMSYEEGVADAIRWMVGDEDSVPIGKN